MGKKKKERVFIFGDTILRNVYDSGPSKLTKHKFNVKSRFYPGARFQCNEDHVLELGSWCNEDHVKPTLHNSQASQIILHVGKNHLMTGKTPMQICTDINLATNQKCNMYLAMMDSIRKQKLSMPK